MLGALREIMKQAIPKAAASVGYQVRSEAYKEFADYLAPILILDLVTTERQC